MHALDLFVLIGYLGIILAIGAYCARSNKDFTDFIFGGGKMPSWAIGISLIATSVSATTFLGNPADAFANDMTFLMCNFGVFGAIAVIWFVFIPRFRRLKVTSAYEILEVRFGRPVRLLASVLYTLHLLLRTGILIYGPALVLAEVFGMSLWLAICAISLMAMLYTWFGGLRAVVWTDVMQFVVLFGGGLAAIYFCVRGIGSFDEMVTMAREAGKTRWLAFGIDPGEARTFLSAGVVYVVFEVAIRGCDQQFVQRYMACKDVGAANRSSLISAVLGLAVALLFYWVGAALYAYFEVAGVAVLPEGTGVNRVFPFFILEVMPVGLTGLLVAAIFAAAMSSLDSAVTALANTSVKDFLPSRRLEGLDAAAQLLLTRRFVLLWGVMGTLVAFVCVFGQQSLLVKALSLTSLFTGPLLGLFLLAFFFPKADRVAVFAGAVLGMLSLLPFVELAILPFWEPVFPVSWPWNPLISLTGTLIAAGLLHLVSSLLEET